MKAEGSFLEIDLVFSWGAKTTAQYQICWHVPTLQNQINSYKKYKLKYGPLQLLQAVFIF